MWACIYRSYLRIYAGHHTRGPLSCGGSWIPRTIKADTRGQALYTAIATSEGWGA